MSSNKDTLIFVGRHKVGALIFVGRHKVGTQRAANQATCTNLWRNSIAYVFMFLPQDDHGKPRLVQTLYVGMMAQSRLSRISDEIGLPPASKTLTGSCLQTACHVNAARSLENDQSCQGGKHHFRHSCSFCPGLRLCDLPSLPSQRNVGRSFNPHATLNPRCRNLYLA